LKQNSVYRLHTKYITYSIQTGVFPFRLVLSLFGFSTKNSQKVYSSKELKYIDKIFTQYLLMPHLANRIATLHQSPTLSLNAAVNRMKADGVNVLNLSVGQPDMPTPWHICDAAIAAIGQGKHGYTPANGIIELRQAIADRYLRDHAIQFDPATEITTGVGAKELLLHACLAVLNPGDEVLVPTPCWTTYFEQIKLAGGVPVPVPLQDFRRISADELAVYRTPRTRAVILNSPCNPTGAVFVDEDLRDVAAFAVQSDLLIISDEMYDKITFDDVRCTPLAVLCPQARDRIITINGVSKAYAMTGWRLGFACADAAYIEAMNRLESQSTSNTSVITQWAAVEALTNGDTAVHNMVKTFASRRQAVITACTNIPGISYTIPDGAFYFFVDIRGVLQPNQTSAQWCQQLLYQKQVAVVSGEAFDTPGFIRLSFAAHQTVLVEAMDRIREFVVGWF